MENQPEGDQASILICRNPEFSEADERLVEALCSFVGRHYYIEDNVTGVVRYILMTDYHEIAGTPRNNQVIDEYTRLKVIDAAILPDLN